MLRSTRTWPTSGAVADGFCTERARLRLRATGAFGPLVLSLVSYVSCTSWELRASEGFHVDSG